MVFINPSIYKNYMQYPNQMMHIKKDNGKAFDVNILPYKQLASEDILQDLVQAKHNDKGYHHISTQNTLDLAMKKEILEHLNTLRQKANNTSSDLNVQNYNTALEEIIIAARKKPIRKYLFMPVTKTIELPIRIASHTVGGAISGAAVGIAKGAVITTPMSISNSYQTAKSYGGKNIYTKRAFGTLGIIGFTPFAVTAGVLAGAVAGGLGGAATGLYDGIKKTFDEKSAISCLVGGKTMTHIKIPSYKPPKLSPKTQSFLEQIAPDPKFRSIGR
jgi:hypothetical protein